MSLTDPHRESALAMRAALLADTVPPDGFRAALTSVPSPLRDAWLDVVLDTAEIPPDDDDFAELFAAEPAPAKRKKKGPVEQGASAS